MHFRLIAIGTKMPAWVNEGYQDYANRFPPGWRLELHEIPAEKRTKNADVPRLIEREGEKILNLLNPTHRLIALDVEGHAYSTPELAKQLTRWSQDNSCIDFIIGGADGLSPLCLKKAEKCWSLSPLTLPHPLVRIVLAEQLYRAYSILQNHPYHRG